MSDSREFKTNGFNPPRGVKLLDIRGNEVASFNSIKEASEKSGVNASCICNCCRGRTKTAGGSKWEYDNSKLKTRTDPLDSQLDFL
jgi:hypothetical protein